MQPIPGPPLNELRYRFIAITCVSAQILRNFFRLYLQAQAEPGGQYLAVFPLEGGIDLRRSVQVHCQWIQIVVPKIGEQGQSSERGGNRRDDEAHEIGRLKLRRGVLFRQTIRRGHGGQGWAIRENIDTSFRSAEYPGEQLIAIRTTTYAVFAKPEKF